MTLAVLAVLFLTGVAWAWSTVTDPFPEKVDQPACTESTFTAGDRVTPGNVLVNVFNASGTDGLAGETMDALVRRGFAEGAISNTAARTGESGVLIWTTEPDGPALKLLLTYFAKDTQVVDQATADPGITIVVGEGFPGLRDGRTGVKVKEDGVVCSPPSS